MASRPSPSAETIMAIRDLVYRLVGPRLAHLWSERTGEWDLDGLLAGSRQTRKNNYLAVLRAGREAMAALDITMAMAAKGAMRNGADFAEIGAAQGMSRQAARQAFLRGSAKRTVTLVGGPRDGQRTTVVGREAEILYGVPDPWLKQNSWIEDDEPVTAVYQKKHGAPDLFEFRHYRNHDGTITAELDPRPRVGQIAHTWGLSSWDLLNYLRKVDPRIRNEASHVDLDTVEELEVLLSANAAPARPADEGDDADADPSS